MTKWFLSFFFFCALSVFLTAQSLNYYKSFNTVIGASAISINTLSAKTYSFSHPVYKILSDTISGNFYVSTRQKDASGKSYTNKGFHLILKNGDSACCVLEDSKLDLNLAGEYYIISNDLRSARINNAFGYEQFEYPAKIFYTIENNTAFTYNPAFIIEGKPVVSNIRLSDGSVVWSAPIPNSDDWNSISEINDSNFIIAASGLHAVNATRGLLWSHSLNTSDKKVSSFTYSSFSSITFSKWFPEVYAVNSDLITQITSNCLISDSLIYIAGKNKMLAVNKTGKVRWEKDLSKYPMSNCLLIEQDENILLVNNGIARYKDNLIQYGKPFILMLNKVNGNETSKQFTLNTIADVSQNNGAVLIAHKNEVLQISKGIIKSAVVLDEKKFGNFLEFVNGDEFYVEKEGFYVPLNFINDNVIYFRTDHGKVFGVNSTGVEYEYHFTELFKFNLKVGNKKLISQQNTSLLISGNNELLHTFNKGEKTGVLNHKIYFIEENLLHVVDLTKLK